MKSAAFALALGLAFLPGCSGLTTATTALNGSVSQVAPDAVNTAKKLLTATHEAHRVAADLLTVAANTNLCHATCASEAKVLLDQSEAVLLAGDTAAQLGDAVGVEAKIATATTLIAQAEALVGKK